MTTLAEHMIVAGAENRPTMLDKTMYNSWQSHMLLYIKGKKNGRMILESIENGPLVYPTIEENGQIRNKKYAELTEQEKLQDDCDVQAINIVLQGLPPDVCSLVNHCQAAKDIWDRGESLHEYYFRFAKLINDMHIIGMTMQQVQVKIKFLNALQPEWSKFITDVKLAKNMYNTKFNQLYAYLSLAVLVFLPGADIIACLKKAMAFMSTVVASLQGRHGQSYAGTETKGNATSSGENKAAGQARVVKCYNCQGEGHMARQCTKPKRLRNYAWFKEKMLLVQAHESGQVLDEEQLAFLTNPDAYDSDCDDISSAKVLMANLSSYDSDVLSENRNALKQEIDSLKQTLSKQQIRKRNLYCNILLPLSNPKSEQLDVTQTPVEIEVPKELPI
ncbi:retrovirus-related pol polyprotein from transposon TNT 1-94, partial [Tanacetum coccineum]